MLRVTAEGAGSFRTAMTATYHARRPHTAERTKQKEVDDSEAVLDLRDVRRTAHLVTDDAQRQLSTQTALLVRHLSHDGTTLSLQQLVWLSLPLYVCQSRQ